MDTAVGTMGTDVLIETFRVQSHMMLGATELPWATSIDGGTGALKRVLGEFIAMSIDIAIVFL